MGIIRADVHRVRMRGQLHSRLLKHTELRRSSVSRCYILELSVSV